MNRPRSSTASAMPPARIPDRRLATVLQELEELAEEANDLVLYTRHPGVTEPTGVGAPLESRTGGVEGAGGAAHGDAVRLAQALCRAGLSRLQLTLEAHRPRSVTVQPGDFEPLRLPLRRAIYLEALAQPGGEFPDGPDGLIGYHSDPAIRDFVAHRTGKRPQGASTVATNIGRLRQALPWHNLIQTHPGKAAYRFVLKHSGILESNLQDATVPVPHAGVQPDVA